MEELKTKLCTEGAQALEENEEKEFMLRKTLFLTKRATSLLSYQPQKVLKKDITVSLFM